MIEFKNVNKFINNKHILKNINLHIKENEIIALIGPSGAGKSTLLRCINALEIAQNGTLRVKDININYEKLESKKIHNIRLNTSMVFQHYNLFNNKNVLENVSEALIVVHKMKKPQAESKARFYLNQVGLGDKEKSYAHELSGGQAQRIGIARALALESSILLLDEPTSSLDPELVSEVLEQIKKIKNKTMVLVTHELNFAKALADRIVFMADGEILEVNKPSDFFNSPQTNRAKVFLEKMNNYKEYL